MRKLLLLLIASANFYLIHAQQLTLADYKRAASFLYRPNLINKKVFNLSVNPIWAGDSSGFAFITRNKEGVQFNRFDYRKKEISPLFDLARVQKLLADSLKRPVTAENIATANLKYPDKNHLTITIGSKEAKVDLSNYSASFKNQAPPGEMEQASPDGQWIAYTEKYNLFIKSTKTGAVKQLSTAGFKNYEYASYYGWGEIIYGENGERPPHFAVRWSPDSKWIQTYICDLRNGSKMFLLDWSVDTLYRPKLLSYYRGSPGDTNMVYMTPVIFNIETGEEIRKDEFRNVNASNLEWSKEPGICYIENQVRGYQQVDLYRFDVRNKSQELLFCEKSNTNTDGYNSWMAEEWGKIIIASEKDGWRQLYSLDLKSKTLSPLTAGEYYIHDVSINKESRTIFFIASGKEPGRNPYLKSGYRIGADGKGFKLLTPEDANHDIFISPDGKFFVDNISTLAQPTKTFLRDAATGTIVKEISKAIIDDLLAMKYSFPETFTATARDGITTIYGAIWKPTHFDATKKYAVIDQSYTGPHTNMYPANFTSALGRSNQALAELGFIVVTIDGMGTAGRSKAFHNVSYKNMGKNLTDHVLAIKQLGRKNTWIDTNRVGIFGHSAGGYDAGHAVLEFPDFYKVAVASSADHDFRMEKDWWPEMYMGWPVDSTYHLASNITMAGNLKGKLLITHGGIDENVNPSATFKLAEALVKANKEFDMLIFPSQRHGYQGKVGEYFTRKQWNYFVKYLLGAEPIWEFELMQ